MSRSAFRPQTIKTRRVLLIALLAVFTSPWSASAEPGLTQVAEEFTTVEPYQKQTVTPLQHGLQERLDSDPDSVLLPGARLAPPTRALLKLQAAESRVAPVRYRIRYGQIQVPNPPKSVPLTVSLIQVDRFNLGPVRQAELERVHGTGNVRADAFAAAEHVSWRFAMRPVMGTTAMTAAASRAVIPQAFAESMDCLGIPCTATASVEPPPQLQWQPAEAPDPRLQADYSTEENGIPSAAALLDLLLVEARAASRNDRISWRGVEPREGVAQGAPFIDIVIETGLGTEAHIAGVLRDDYLMDHLARAEWFYLQAVATAPDQAPAMALTRAQVPWPPPTFD